MAFPSHPDPYAENRLESAPDSSSVESNVIDDEANMVYVTHEDARASSTPPVLRDAAVPEEADGFLPVSRPRSVYSSASSFPSSSSSSDSLFSGTQGEEMVNDYFQFLASLPSYDEIVLQGSNSTRRTVEEKDLMQFQGYTADNQKRLVKVMNEDILAPYYIFRGILMSDYFMSSDLQAQTRVLAESVEHLEDMATNVSLALVKGVDGVSRICGILEPEEDWFPGLVKSGV